MLLTDCFQTAYVTRDLDRTVELMKTRYGIEDFLLIDPEIDVLTPEGMRHSRCRAAMGWADDKHMFEIIQPLPGATVDIYSEYLPDDDSPRFHHIAVRTFDWEQTHRQVRAEGWSIAVEHHMPEGLNFMYVDCRATLGHYVEYIWATPEMWAFTGGK
ncbi:VOC family protein [Haliea sp. E17]|uniref:VOC family protein n=1 Tax=Haliea sp. E17 TaxID=3401576 RepID=UPI003AAD6086